MDESILDSKIEQAASQYCIADLGYYGNSLGAISGTGRWSTSSYHSYIPKENDKERRRHLNKWMNDNGYEREILEAFPKMKECRGNGRGSTTSCNIM